jgi:hypothetical protein
MEVLIAANVNLFAWDIPEDCHVETESCKRGTMTAIRCDVITCSLAERYECHFHLHGKEIFCFLRSCDRAS